MVRCSVFDVRNALRKGLLRRYVQRAVPRHPPPTRFARRRSPLGPILDSSMVEHSAVNRGVVGSSPTRGAIKLNQPYVGTQDKECRLFVKSTVFRRHSQAVRQGSATPVPPVRFRLSPECGGVRKDSSFLLKNRVKSILFTSKLT